MGTAPNWSYGFALTMLFVLLFLLRFLQTRRGVHLTATGLTLVANIYGNPQYLVIPETYLAVLFLLMAGLRFRDQLRAEWRSIIRSLFTVPSLAIAALTAMLLLGLVLIDREILQTVTFTPLDRDPHTLKTSLRVFLYYVNLTSFRRLPDLFTGRPITTPDISLYFGATSLSVLFRPLPRMANKVHARTFDSRIIDNRLFASDFVSFGQMGILLRPWDEFVPAGQLCLNFCQAVCGIGGSVRVRRSVDA